MSEESFDYYLQRRKMPISDIEYCQFCQCWVPRNFMNTAHVGRVPTIRQSKKKTTSGPSVRVPVRRSIRVSPAARKYSSRQPAKAMRRRQRQKKFSGLKYKTQRKSCRSGHARNRRASAPIDNPDVVPYATKASQTRNRNKIYKRTSAKTKTISKSSKLKSKETKSLKKRAQARSEQPLKRNRSYKRDAVDNTAKNSSSLLNCTQCGNLITSDSSSSSLTIEKPTSTRNSKISDGGKVEMQQRRSSVLRPSLLEPKIEKPNEGSGDHVPNNANSNEKLDDNDIGKRTKSNLTQQIDEQ